MNKLIEIKDKRHGGLRLISSGEIRSIEQLKDGSAIIKLRDEQEGRFFHADSYQDVEDQL